MTSMHAPDQAPEGGAARASEHNIPHRVLRRAEVSARTGLGRSTLYAQIQAGSFPQSVKLGTRAVGWIEAEVAEWIAARVEARDRAERSQ